MSVPLLTELQRRRVFRALVGYGLAAFGVLQIVEPVMHGLHWTDAVLSYVVVALAAGFPVVVGLAWIFDVNAGRLKRTAAARQATALRGPVLALLLVGIGALAAAPGLVWYFVLRGRNSAVTVSPRAPSIAVLPFVNLSGGQENEYFSDGVTEEIINALANLPEVRVVARTSAFSLKGKNLNVRQIGEELNVATVLEGSVRRDGNQLRVVAQLIDATSGYHLFSKTWDREVRGVFALEDELARAIVQALKPRLVQAPTLVQPATSSSEAYDLYLRGRYFWNQRTAGGLAKASALFAQAIAIDPDFALAHSGLADSYTLSIDYGYARPADVLPSASAHASQAVKLDASLAEAHASLGIARMTECRWSSAELELKRAIELRPGYASAHQWLALELGATGRVAEGLAEAELARQLDPTSKIINNVVTIMLRASRQDDRALAQAIRTLELDPSSTVLREMLAISYEQLGRFADALGTLDKGSAQDAWLRCLRVRLLAALGQRPAAQRLLDDIERRLPVEPAPPGLLASAHLALGDSRGAFQWLERGVEGRDQLVMFYLQTNPWWDPIRTDARYHELLKRMNLE